MGIQTSDEMYSFMIFCPLGFLDIKSMTLMIYVDILLPIVIAFTASIYIWYHM